MAQPFSFGFGSEDLDDSVETEVSGHTKNLSDQPTEQGSPLSEPRLHTLEEMVSHDQQLALNISCYQFQDLYAVSFFFSTRCIHLESQRKTI